MLTSVEFAQQLGVPKSELMRLVHAGLLVPAAHDETGESLWERGTFAYARLLLDLLDAGMTLLQLRRIAKAAGERRTAAGAALAVDIIIEDALPIIRARLERIQRVVDDLERTRDSLKMCNGCHRPMEELGCRTCTRMPDATPRALDAFFLDEDDPAHGRSH
jgi:DNA-binding transcriptional MerR regulator